MIACTLGPLAACKARELVKVKTGNAIEWAIVGAPAPGLFPLIFLTGENAPFVVNVQQYPGDFERHPVAKYGTNYRFAHDPSGPCQIGDDRLTAGSLVLTEDGEWHLIVNGPRDVSWLHLESGNIMGEPGSRRIAFGNWSLCIEGLKHERSETPLLSYPRADAG
jgi:hypothetical protein